MKATQFLHDLGQSLWLECAVSFVKSWNEWLEVIATKSAALKLAT
jgi:hypothetical protein